MSMPNTSNNMHTRGIEPRSQAWKACMMPLHYVCDCITSSPKGKRDSWSVRGEEAGGAHDGIERCGACTASHTRIVCARPHKIACVYQPVHVTGYVCLCQYGHPYLTSGSLMYVCRCMGGWGNIFLPFVILCLQLIPGSCC